MQSDERFRLEAESWRRHLDDVVEAIADGVVIVGRDGRFEFANKGAERILGVPREQIIGRSFSEPAWKRRTLDDRPFPEEDLPYARVLRTGKGVSGVRFKIQRPDGTEVAISVSAEPLRDERGRLIAMVATHRDVTERTKAAQALRASEERFRMLVERIPDSLFLHDMTGTIVDVNEQTVRSLGYSRQELIGMSVTQVETNYRAEELPQIWGSVFESGAGTLSGTHRRKDGTEFPVEVRVAAFLSEGTQLVLALARDVTARVEADRQLAESQERYRSLVDASPDAIVVHEAPGRITFANPAAVELLGASSAGQLIGRSVFDFVHPDSKKFVAERVRVMITQRISLPPAEEKYVRLDGRVIYVELAAIPFIWEGQEAVQVVARDISQRAETEQALKEKDMAIRRAYVDVLGAVTGNRLILMTEEEIGESLGTPVTSPLSIKTYRELSQARAFVKKTLAERFPKVKSTNEFIVGMCEALTNAVKHAGGGTYQIFKCRKSAQVVVADKGSGIDFKNLPKATLAPGFSTQQTLGMGFTIMLDLSDRLLLATGPNGTTLVLEVSK